MFCYEGDTVLDPWLGSGTTVKVARELNREAVGYEKEPQYKAVIMKKLGISAEKPDAQFFTNMMAENIKRVLANEGDNPEEPCNPTDVECAETTNLTAQRLATPAPEAGQADT